jgi:hypothetical protein
METAAADARERLAREGRLRPDAPDLTPELPRTWRRTLEEALRRERASADPDAPARAAALCEHWLVRLPQALAEQVGSSTEPWTSLFHTPVAWHRLPRFGAALRRLARLARLSDIPAALALGAASPSALTRHRPTLARLHLGFCFGASSPLLYATEHDVRAYAAERPSVGSLAALLDRRLAAPLVHELSHLGRHRDAAQPPIIDECISAWLGVLLLPELIWPAPGQDNALMGAGWFAQTGQLLFHLVGRRALLRAHAGVDPIEAIWPGDLGESLLRLGWERWERDHAPHFLGGHDDPEPLAKLIWLARAAQPTAPYDLAALRTLDLADLATAPPTAADRAIVTAGLRSMALRTTLRDGAWRVRAAPAPAAVTLDARQGLLIAPPEPDLPHLPPLRWVLPPSVIAALRQGGVDQAVIAPFTPDAIPALATAITRGHIPR